MCNCLLTMHALTCDHACRQEEMKLSFNDIINYCNTICIVYRVHFSLDRLQWFPLLFLENV